MEDEKPRLPSDETLTVTLLSSEWKSSKGGLSTISRELAIQFAKHLNVKVYVYLPKCTEEDKKVALSHSVQLIEAEELPGFEPIDWLNSLPKGHHPHCLIGHGLHLGRQIPLIKRHHDCKWVQVVHTAPEELGMYKSYEEAIFKGEQKHQAEVKLCELADHVVAVGPKLADAYSRYLRSSSKDQDVINLTPSIFTEFLNVKQATEERRKFCVLVFGRGDGEDFKLKGYDIAVQAVAELKDSSYHLMFVGVPAGKEDEVAEKLLQHGIPPSQLTVRRFMESREELAKLFCEVDLAIMPSRTEGFGLTALEALSAGLPVLVSGNSGLGDALKEVPSGFPHVVDSEDPKEWAKAINIVRQKGREVRLEDANLLREKYVLKYSWQEQCDCLVEKMLHLSFGSIQDKLEQEQNQVENANEKVGNLEKLKETSQEAAVKLKVDVEAMTPTEHSTQDRTTVLAVESGGSRTGRQHGASVVPVSGQNQSSYANTGAPQAPRYIPTTEEIFRSIADNFLKNTPPQNRDEHDYFLTYLKEIRATLTSVSTGSLLITVKCDSLQALERLWEDYLSGDLGKVIQRSFVTEEILTEFSLAELKLKTTISEEEYEACKAYFKKDLSEGGKRLEDNKDEPPEHTIVVPNLDDLPRDEKRSDRRFLIDILLVTVEVCEFLSCYAHLKSPFECYVASVGTYVFFGQDAGTKIGLMRRDEAFSDPESYLRAVKKAITELRPKVAISVGYCSGLNKLKTKLGDVVIPAELTTYASKMVDGEEQFTSSRHLVSPRFLQPINHVADGWKAPLKSPEVREVKVHGNGEILSGPEKVNTDERRDQLVQLYPKAVAVEMKGEGTANAYRKIPAKVTALIV